MARGLAAVAVFGFDGEVLPRCQPQLAWTQSTMGDDLGGWCQAAAIDDAIPTQLSPVSSTGMKKWTPSYLRSIQYSKALVASFLPGAPLHGVSADSTETPVRSALRE